MENFEEQLRKDLHQFLLSMNEVDERMPECPDAPTPRTRHEGGLQCLRRLSAPAIPLWSSHAAEAYGLSHDEDVIDISRLPK